MFGYITPVQGELTVNDLNKFKTYYCGLCLCLKNKFGNIPRIFLNYDTTFFAVFLDGLCKGSPKEKSSNCIRHPFTKRNFIYDNEALDYAADLNITFVYYKLLDNILDANDLKSLGSSKVLKYYYSKITNKKLKDTIFNSLSDLHTLEKSRLSYPIDTISHPFSHITGSIMRDFPGQLTDDSEKLRETLYNFGYSFGKWIYLIDALDDLKEDLNCHMFNPLEKAYNKNYTYSILVEAVKENLDFTILNLINNCNSIIEKLHFYKNESIIKNTINLGLIDTYMNILYKIWYINTMNI